MTDTTGGYPPPHRESTQETVKQEAAGVARTAAARGGQVGDTAGEQARRVASETAKQARDLVNEGRTQLVEQAKQGQRRAADGLHTLADQLRDMAEKTDGDGMAPEMVRQAADRTRGIATWLDGREPGSLLEDVRTFARRRPAVFLAGAAMAGVLVGRLTRGAVAAASDDPDTGTNGQDAARRDALSRPPVAGDPLPGSATGQPVAAPGYGTPPPPPATTPGHANPGLGTPAGNPMPGNTTSAPTTPSYATPPPPPSTGAGNPLPGNASSQSAETPASPSYSTPPPPHHTGAGNPLPDNTSGRPTGTPGYSVPPPTNSDENPGPVTR